MKSKAKSKALIIVASVISAVVILISGILIHDNNALIVSRYKLNIAELPEAFDQYKIALLTDLHSAEFGNDNEKILNNLKKESPDIVLLGGDMISSEDEDVSVFLKLAENIAKNYEVYYVFGNHELIKDNAFRNKLEQDLEKLGVKVINNKHAKLTKGNEIINLYGMWFNLRYYQSAEAEEQYEFSLASACEILGESSEGFNILLTHSPVYFKTYKEWGADLVLSGHMHGGMIRLPFLGGVFSPEKDYFPEYDKGLYNIENSQMIVSSGLGNGHAGIRFLNAPEITIIELNKVK